MTDTLPPMLTRAQARAFLQCSDRTLSRLMADGTVPYTKLGIAKSAPVRIHRDKMLASLGLESGRRQRRRGNAADAEYHAAMARLGSKGT